MIHFIATTIIEHHTVVLFQHPKCVYSEVGEGTVAEGQGRHLPKRWTFNNSSLRVLSILGVPHLLALPLHIRWPKPYRSLGVYQV